jgi:hypothetical protein
MLLSREFGEYTLLHRLRQEYTLLHKLCQEALSVSSIICYSTVIPITSVLGRLALVPVGDTGTIPYSMRQEASTFPGAA